MWTTAWKDAKLPIKTERLYDTFYNGKHRIFLRKADPGKDLLHFHDGCETQLVRPKRIIENIH